MPTATPEISNSIPLEDGCIRGDVLSLEKQFVGMGVPAIRQLKQLEDENSKIESFVAVPTLDRSTL